MGWSYDLELPVTVGERTISKITFPDHVRTRHVMAADGYLNGSAGAEVAFIAALCGESETLVKEIEVCDMAIIRNEANKWYLRYAGALPRPPKEEGNKENPQKETTSQSPSLDK